MSPEIVEHNVRSTGQVGQPTIDSFTVYYHIATEAPYRLRPQDLLAMGTLSSSMGTSPMREQMSKQLESLQSKVRNLEKLVGVIEDIRDILRERPIVIPTYIYNVNSSHFKLNQPLFAVLEQYEEEVVARIPELEVRGSGNSELEALAGLKEDLIELYEDLASTSQDQMGRLPKNWWHLLSSVMEKIG